MKNTIIALALVASTVTLTACSQTERGTAIGAASGAIIGGAVTGRPAAHWQEPPSAALRAISSPGRTGTGTASIVTVVATATKPVAANRHRAETRNGPRGPFRRVLNRKEKCVQEPPLAFRSASSSFSRRSSSRLGTGSVSMTS